MIFEEIKKLAENLTYVRSLEWFDGDLLAEWTDGTNPWVMKWCSCSGNFEESTWIATKTTHQNILNYLHGKTAMYRLFEWPQSPVLITFSKNETVRVEPVVFNQVFRRKYGPSENAYHDKDLRPPNLVVPNEVRKCNLHEDCIAADKLAEAHNASQYHCDYEDCEDCLGDE